MTLAKTDDTSTDTSIDQANADNCGCCLPPPNATNDVVERLLGRRDALDERLGRLKLAGATR